MSSLMNFYLRKTHASFLLQIIFPLNGPKIALLPTSCSAILSHRDSAGDTQRDEKVVSPSSCRSPWDPGWPLKIMFVAAGQKSSIFPHVRKCWIIITSKISYGRHALLWLKSKQTSVTQVFNGVLPTDLSTHLPCSSVAHFMKPGAELGHRAVVSRTSQLLGL